MGDIEETAERYQDVCIENEVKTHPYIVKVFEKEKDDCISLRKKGEKKDHMFLDLCGNNKVLTDTRLADLDVDILYKVLKNNVYITGLDLRYNNITDEGAKSIAKLLEESAVLESLNIMCNDITEEGAEHIAQALHNNDVLLILRINGNKIGNKGGMYFAQALQLNTALEFLDLGDTDQKTESVIALATVLNYNKTLRALNLNRPILFTHQEETTVHFAKMLKVNRTLKRLDLQKYDMRDFGATRLAEHLMHNFTLTYLDLSCNRITRDGTKEIAKLLKHNTALEVLDLGQNRLEDDGATYIAEALATYNTNLTTLVVKYNNIGGKGLCALADCLKLNTSLCRLYIWGNNLEESACIAFSSLISAGRLDAIDTDVRAYVVDGVTYLAELSHGIRQYYHTIPFYPEPRRKYEELREEGNEFLY